MGILTKIAGLITLLNKYFFVLSTINILLLIICSFVIVILRYLFNYSYMWADELLWHFFGASFLLAAPYCLHTGSHVRVDLFYEKFSPKTKNIVDFAGTLFFLIPVTIMIIYFGYHYAVMSWNVSEKSGNPNGLPWRWFIKGLAPFTYLMLCLQGIAFILIQIVDFFKKPSESSK